MGIEYISTLCFTAFNVLLASIIIYYLFKKRKVAPYSNISPFWVIITLLSIMYKINYRCLLKSNICSITIYAYD